MKTKKNPTYMPNNDYLKIPSRQEFHQRFSGVIYLNDYSYPTSLTTVANRVASNLKFDETCKLNRELKESNKQNTTK